VRPLAPAFGVLLLTIGLLQDAFSGTPPTLARSSDAREVIAALHRADSVRGPGAVRVAFFSPRVLTWETGIPSTAFAGGHPDSLFAEAQRRRITHVVTGDAQTNAPGTAETIAMITRHRAAYEQVLANRSFVLYESRLLPDTLR
jgi:hypothetical protein